MAVCITADKGPQDHHVQGALEHFILWLAALFRIISPLGLLWERIIHHSNLYGNIKN
jgi:hypothetical protein